jgi:hypothetical protein
MTKKIKSVVYGIGGFDESKPENNVIEIVHYSDEELSKLAVEEKAAATKALLLKKLGITAEEAALLLS